MQNKDGVIARSVSWVKGARTAVVPVVPLRGVIGQVGAFRRGLTVDTVGPLLSKAFRVKRAKAVALIINSPGGSPVQSSLIAARIRQLSDENELPVLAFCEDVAASGGYWLAAAADEIFVDRSSIVGSIGVISSGFGFAEAIKKLGIQRRMHTAGDNKSFLDPFSPENKKDVERLKSIQGDMHETFRNYVAERRGEKLPDDPEVFSGAFWTGSKAIEMGLVDQVGEIRQVLRDKFGDKVQTPLIKADRSWFARRFSGMSVGPDDVSMMADGVVAAVEDRFMWDRYRF